MASQPPASPFPDTLLRLTRVIASFENASSLKPVHWEVLRYLSRANRFSNTPSALSLFLRSTKGTVSQSLNALSRRGLIEKRSDARSARVVRLFLTEAGRAMLAKDPVLQIEQALPVDRAERERLAPALALVLRALQKANRLKPFGTCRSCRYFRAGATGGAFCGLLAEPLSEEDAGRICHEHAETA